MYQTFNGKMKKLLLLFFCTFSYSLLSQSYENFRQTGIASYYVDELDGRMTVSGEIFDNTYFIAGHQTLPFNTMVRVTNLDNNKFVVVRIVDRGPYAHGRIIDVSKAAAKKIGLVTAGSAKVEIEVVGEEGKIYGNGEEEEEDIEETVIVKKEEPKDNSSVFESGKTYSQWGTLTFPEGYGIQIGYFSSLENAQSLCKELVEEEVHQKYYLYIQVNQDGASKKYRVIVGDFPEEDSIESRQALHLLEDLGHSGFPKKH